MPRLYIETEHSHMGGLELLKMNKPYLYQEILTIFKTTEIPKPIKKSREKTMKGRMVWSGPAFNKPLSESFKRLGWSKKRYNLKTNSQHPFVYLQTNVHVPRMINKILPTRFLMKIVMMLIVTISMLTLVVSARSVTIDDVYVSNEVCVFWYNQTIGFHVAWADTHEDATGVKLSIIGDSERGYGEYLTSVGGHFFEYQLKPDDVIILAEDLWGQGYKAVLLLEHNRINHESFRHVFQPKYRAEYGGETYYFLYDLITIQKHGQSYFEHHFFNPIERQLNQTLSIYNEDEIIILFNPSIEYDFVHGIISKYPLMSKIKLRYLCEETTDNAGWIYFTAYPWWGKNTYHVIKAEKDETILTITQSKEAHLYATYALINETGVSKTKADINTIQTMWVKTDYTNYDENLDGSNAVIEINNEPLTWSNNRKRWEINVTSSKPTVISYNVTKFTEKYDVSRIPIQPLALIKWVIPTNITLNAVYDISEQNLININGNVAYYNGTKVKRVPITIEYSITKGETWQLLTEIETLNDGTFEYKWKPSVVGTFLFRVNITDTSYQWMRYNVPEFLLSPFSSTQTSPSEIKGEETQNIIPSFTTVSIAIGVLIPIMVYTYKRESVTR